MNIEKILLIISGVFIVFLSVFGGFYFIKAKSTAVVITESRSDIDRINELQSRINGYDNKINELEQRAINITNRELSLNDREYELELRAKELDDRFIEITSGEADLIRRKRELEERTGIKLAELDEEIRYSREIVKDLQDYIASGDYNNSPGNN